MLSQENLNTLNSLSFKQVAKLWRTCGYRGDYMKKGGIDILRGNIMARYSNMDTDAANNLFAADIKSAFPEGIYIKGQRRNYSKPATQESVISTSEPKAAETDESDDSEVDAITAAIKSALANRKPSGISEARVLELIKAHIPNETPCFKVEVKIPNLPAIKTDAKPRHTVFGEALDALSRKRNVLLVGPAGSGKTHLGEQLAEALGMRFECESAVGSKYDLLGYKNPEGTYVPTAYFDFYANGGLFLKDEIDADNPNALLAMNAGLANGHQRFPHMSVKRHADFLMLASANTYGNGADRQYVGRNQLDAASLDRFYVIPMDYDEKLERQIFGDCEWVSYVHKARKAVRSLNMRHVVSMRAIDAGLSMLESGQSRKDIERGALWKSLSDADIAKIKAAM